MTFELTNVPLAKGSVPCHIGGAGEPLLCLHSAGGARISPALEALAEKRRLVIPVMPGFDGTKRRGELRTMADLADFAAQVIDATIGKPTDVMGHSFGGWVASWLAVRHPTKVQLLVLHASAGFRPEGVGGHVADPVRLRQLMYAHPENLPAEAKTPEVQALNRATVALYHGTIATDRDLLGALDRVEALTLILHGTKDGIIPTESARLLKERIPRSHLVYVYDAAHAIDIDQPKRFERLVGDFLDRGEAFIVNRDAAAAG